ncbi:MAG: hypothetical protein Q7R52_03335 [archaeon]|nr:hypothetical protein [archaeon]
MNKESYEKNIKEFMKKHGIEGFLEIYFTKFLLNALKFQMKSTLGENNELKEDPGIAFYLHNKKIGGMEDIKKFENELKETCNKIAKQIIKELKEDEEFNDLFEGKIEKIKDKKLEEKFIRELHKIMGGLKNPK